MLPLLKIKFHRTLMSIFNTTLFKFKAIKLLSLNDIFLNFSLTIMYHWFCHGTRVLLPNSNFLGCFCFHVHIHSCDQGSVLLCHLHRHTVTEEEGDRKYDFRLRSLDWIMSYGCFYYNAKSWKPIPYAHHKEALKCTNLFLFWCSRRFICKNMYLLG